MSPLLHCIIMSHKINNRKNKNICLQCFRQTLFIFWSMNMTLDFIDPPLLVTPPLEHLILWKNSFKLLNNTFCSLNSSLACYTINSCFSRFITTLCLDRWEDVFWLVVDVVKLWCNDVLNNVILFVLLCFSYEEVPI